VSAVELRTLKFLSWFRTCIAYSFSDKIRF